MNFYYLVFLLLIAVIAGIVVVLGIYFLRNQGVSATRQKERKTQLMVVDSDANAREMLVKFLRFEKTLEIIGVASSGKTAIEQAKQLHPSVILLNISLADMDGIAVAKILSQEIPSIRFVFIQDTSEPEPQNLAHEIYRPLTKPLDFHELIKAIQRANRYR